MKGTLPQSQYSATKTDIQTTVLDWIRATEEFHRYYIRINEVLNTKAVYDAAGLSSTRSTAVSRRVKNLVKLRQYMTDVLETLMLDISKSTIMPFGANDSATVSKTGQLRNHTHLLKDINRKISRDLASFSTAQVS